LTGVSMSRYRFTMWASALIGMAILVAGVELVNANPVPCNGTPNEVARARLADRSPRAAVCLWIVVLGVLWLLARCVSVI
jgi:hypothetical protein